MDRLGFVAIAALVSVAGCLGDKTAQDETGTVPAATEAVNTQAGNDLADITKFRLTMERMDKYIQAQRNVGEALKAMTPAERKQASIATDPDASLDQMVAQAEANPLLSNAAEKAGMSTREYIMTAVSYAQSSMAASELQAQPNTNSDSLAQALRLHPDNIRFVRDNEAELARKYGGPEGELERLGLIERVR